MKFSRKYLTAMVLAGLGFVVAAPVMAQAPRSLTLANALSIASGSNPDYLSQRNQLTSAMWGVRSAYGNWMPSLSASGGLGYTATGERRLDSVVLGEQPAMYSSRYNLGMSMSVSGQTLLAPSVAKASERAVEEQVQSAGAMLEANVTQRYLSVLEARATAEQAQRELDRTGEHVRLATARFEIGAGTQLDVSRAVVQRGQAEVRLVQAENSAANEVLLLSQLLGMLLPADVELTEQFELFEPHWTVAQLRERAMGENPDLQASRAQADAAASRARAARSTYLPTVSLSAGLTGYVSQAGNLDPLVQQALASARSSFQNCLQQNEIRTAVNLTPGNCIDPSTPGFESSVREAVSNNNRGFPFNYVQQPATASLTVSLPIFTGFSRRQQVEEANVARQNAQHQVRSRELQLEVEITSALRNLETAYRTALLQRQVRDTAREELNLAEERFRFGSNTSIEVVDAQASLADAERAEIAAVYAFHRSLADLRTRTGGELPR
ncbi:MAG: TolC family protein [Gemmatimonadota bacterium]|jgi:outer membrane protein|nr:TolC family protein [Gemmatimonadota bacterium]